MSLYFESLKPIEATPIKIWKEKSKMYRDEINARVEECAQMRNASRRLRYEAQVSKSWDLYYNNIKLENRICEIEKIILYAETMLDEIGTERKLLNDEKFLTEKLMVDCDTWIEVCMNTMNLVDRKLPEENTRDDEVMNQTKKEVGLLEEAKEDLKAMCLTAWEILNRMEVTETKIDLNLEFKREVLITDKICLAISKMDTGVSYKVDPLKGPEKMLSIDEWTKEVYHLVEDGTNTIKESRKLREKMEKVRGKALIKYKIQFETTDFELRKRVYQINKEKNECQFQIKRITEMMQQTMGESSRLELFLKNVKDDLKCAETRCAYRFFRPSVDATTDAPYFGINEEVTHLREKVRDVEKQLHDLRQVYRGIGDGQRARSDRRQEFLTFLRRDLYTGMDADLYRLSREEESKNKSLQFELQMLDMRISGRYDPKKEYAYSADVLAQRMIRQLPPPFVLYSSKI